MEEKAIRGVPWTLLTFASNKVIVFLTTIALARLLEPEDFGLVALALVAVGVLSVVRDLGLGGVLIVRQDLDDRAKGTVLTLVLAFSTITAGFIAAVSPLAGRILGDARVTDLLAVMSLVALFGGLNVFYDTVLQRELEFSRRFVASLVGSVVYAGVALGLAATGAGPWSLAGGLMASMGAGSVALYALSPYRLRPTWDRGYAWEVVRSGRGFLVQSYSSHLAQSADFLAVGGFLGPARLGYYTLAYRVAELPFVSLTDPISKVTFSGFARMRHRGEDVRPTFLSTLRLIALVTSPIAVVLSASAEPLVLTFFGDKWLPMTAPLMALGIWSALRSVSGTIGWYLNSVGQSWAMGIASTLLLAPLIGALVVAAKYGSITVVAWALVGNAALILVVNAALGQRQAELRVQQQWQAIRGVVLASALAWIVSWAIVQVTDGLSAVASLLASAGAGFAVYAIAVSVLDPGILRVAVGQVARTLGRRPAAVGGGGG